jgi:hypothetical protein
MALVLLFIATFFLVVGCASQRDRMLEEGYPRSYVDGFDDGCHSGKKAGGSMFDQFKKDVRRFETDKEYAQGWSDGFRQCETEEEALERQIRMSQEQQRLMEQRRHDKKMEKHYLEEDYFKGKDLSSLKNLEKK